MINRMKIVFTILILIIAVQCFAQYKAPMYTWDIIYFETAAIGTISLNHLVFDYYWDAFICALGIAIFKEIGDEFYKHGCFGKPNPSHWFWDSRGFDSRDLGLTVLSISISFPLRRRGHGN